MAKKKTSGGSLERQIAAARKKIAQHKSKVRAEKAKRKKAALLISLKKKLKNLR